MNFSFVKLNVPIERNFKNKALTVKLFHRDNVASPKTPS